MTPENDYGNKKQVNANSAHITDSGERNVGTGGGQREHYYPMYELLEPTFLERVAKVMTAGAVKYQRDNWKKFDDTQILDIQRHAFKHIVDYMQGDCSEDHLANAACNIMFLMFFEAQGRTTREVVKDGR